MQKTIEVVYEKGVFKPLEPVELEEGSEILIRVKKVVPDIQTTKKILSELDYLPRRKVNLKLAEELYHEGKISD
jgi:predicted DNA-binding antitoxin AbrB/MazE fold protein